MLDLPPLRRSTVIIHQVLISGQVRDSLAVSEGLPVTAPRGALTVRLIDRDTGGDYPLAGKVMPDGSFAFFGSPLHAFPGFATRIFHLRVEASTPFHASNGVDFDLAQTGDPPQPTLVTIPEPLPGQGDIPAILFNASGLPHTGIVIDLDPNAVRLAGRVVSAADPLTGLEDVDVQLNPNGGPTVSSDAAGRFEFPAPLPVARSVELEASKAGFETNRITLDLDYSNPVNEITIVMKQN